MTSRPLDAHALAELRRAKRLLERPSFLVRLTNLLGTPVEWALRRLPAPVSRQLTKATTAAVEAGLKTALVTLEPRSSRSARDWAHRGMVAVTGGVGGFFSVAALAVELPITTVIMLRSIAENARAQGEDLDSVEARLNCVMVLALGAQSTAAMHDRGESATTRSSYFGARIAIARMIAETVEFVAERGIAEAVANRSAPALARLVATVSQRFGIVVSEKAVAQAAPVLGAIGGAGINLAFMGHFQDVAFAHFSIRRLERIHGADAVRRAYEAMD